MIVELIVIGLLFGAMAVAWSCERPWVAFLSSALVVHMSVFSGNRKT